jgi:hypothetical protein
MSCDPQSFDGVTPEVFQALNSKLQGLGLSLPGREGTIKGPMGIVMEYRWDEKAQVLHTQITGKNFLVPCSKINSELAKAIRQSQR